MGKYPTQRRSPIRHIVHQYVRKVEGQKVKVGRYLRGKGTRFTANRLSPIAESRRHNLTESKYLVGDEASSYMNYVQDSLHGGLEVNKFAEPVQLKLIRVKSDQLKAMTSDRPDFEESVQYHLDEIRNGKTISPVLVHWSPDGKFQILDGNARAEAYRRMGITEFPAVENGLLSSIGKAAGTVVKGAAVVGSAAIKTGAKAAKVVGSAAKGFSIRRVQDVRARRLLTQIYEGTPTQVTFAKAELRRRFPAVYNEAFPTQQANIPTSVIIHRHETIKEPSPQEVSQAIRDFSKLNAKPKSNLEEIPKHKEKSKDTVKLKHKLKQKPEDWNSVPHYGDELKTE